MDDQMINRSGQVSCLLCFAAKTGIDILAFFLAVPEYPPTPKDCKDTGWNVTKYSGVVQAAINAIRTDERGRDASSD